MLGTDTIHGDKVIAAAHLPYEEGRGIRDRRLVLVDRGAERGEVGCRWVVALENFGDGEWYSSGYHNTKQNAVDEFVARMREYLGVG